MFRFGCLRFDVNRYGVQPRNGLQADERGVVCETEGSSPLVQRNFAPQPRAVRRTDALPRVLVLETQTGVAVLVTTLWSPMLALITLKFIAIFIPSRGPTSNPSSHLHE